MEVTKNDLKKLKLQPSLIVFLKAIHTKNNSYLKELNKVSDVFDIAKHLQAKMILKIIGSEVECSSFEIRNLDVVKYLNEVKAEVANDAKKIFQHYIIVMEKHSGKKSGIKFDTYKKFLQGRLNQEIDVETANKIFDIKFPEWWGTEQQRHLNFNTLLGVKHYGQYVQQLDVFESKNDKPMMSTTKMI